MYINRLLVPALILLIVSACTQEEQPESNSYAPNETAAQTATETADAPAEAEAQHMDSPKTTKDTELYDSAPDFTLAAYPDGEVHLASHEGEDIVVLYFYPKDDTPGCTTQACTFRDTFERFQDHGAVIYGVSRDSYDSHASFAEEYELPYPLLIDANGAVLEKYAPLTVRATEYPRITYVIDREGVVRAVIEGVTPEEHVTQALAAVEAIAAGSEPHSTETTSSEKEA
jgi:peroxiredoxin Q/BCP